MLDIYFPVNTLYGTFDSTFDPNTAWGGTWVKITDGRVLVPSATPNVTGGSSTSGSHTLTASESGVPKHTHNYYSPIVQRVQAVSSGSTWGNYNQQYLVATSENTAKNATSGHTHGSINPLNRSYCLWYRTA